MAINIARTADANSAHRRKATWFIAVAVCCLTIVVLAAKYIGRSKETIPKTEKSIFNGSTPIELQVAPKHSFQQQLSATRNPLPASFNLPEMDSIYKDVSLRASLATAGLSKILNSNPERYKYIRKKLPDATRNLHIAALSQALGDPTIRALFLDKLRNPQFFAELKQFAVEDGSSFENTRGAVDGARLLSSIGNMKDRYEEDFRGELRRLGVSDELLPLLQDSAGVGWIKISMDEYMKAHGYYYDALRERFTFSEDDININETAGTFYELRQ